MLDNRLGFIGGGNMASAIISSLLEAKLIPADRIMVFEPDAYRLAELTPLGVVSAPSNRSLVSSCQLTLLCVKPQVMGTVLMGIAPVADGRHFISIAAGLSTDFFKERLGPDAHVLRVMPNAPLAVGCGATVIAKNPRTPDFLLKAARSIFACAGDVVFLEEDMMNEVTAVSGSGPAYFYRFCSAMALAAQEMGLPYDLAVRLAAKTMQGASKMILESDMSLEALIRQVSSPGGTTLAALKVFDDDGLDDAVMRAMSACARRAYELSKSF